ncbi:centromere-associated protein E isoform X3 [Labrus mixtus]|uniref:centromere-associated protein E isoform X3 n=1 Tax=Labrus mixtus TaxID=508554 RepID=UPI0029C07523|nr:centromere-associated protein E isoform X3 [Labrus mixtus]
MTQESAVKVCVRVRPLIEREESAASESAEPAHLFWKADKKSIHQIDDGNSTKSFSFDRVFTAQETTNQLYQNIAKPLVVSTVEGYNGTIFAYGQTSSGKTFTMMGSNGTPGVIPLAVEDVFQTIKNFPKKEFLLRVSYMEIYNETVSDLLVDSWKRKPLEVRETINKNIYVADLTEELVTNPSQALSWIRKGEKNRHYGKTKMNQRSSRSHTIFRMILESRERSDPASGENADGAIIVSHLNLVDLAGSERASQTGAEGARFKEGCNINRSLFTLGQVIKKLTDESQKGFTNYRDSKLTRILQNSLGGNAKTVIICTITPVTLEETLSTLQFASTAKKMKNDPHVTEVSDDGALLKRYRNEIVDLKRRLNEVSSVTQTTATEKDFLSQLLQEKDQLQREQEDRIRNLTQLLVTSSNQISAPKRPKRRVTWGGKMLRLAHPSAFEGGMSELSFAEPFSGKRKAERSYLSEMAGDDEDFHWGIPEDLPEDMELNQSSVTVRSFGDSPKDFVSPDRMRELSSKVSHLEMQLEMEIQQKEEAMMKVETLDDKVSELEQQLQMENQQKGEAMMKVETLDDKVSELEQQLQTENQQKGEAMMKVETLDDKVSELEQQLQTENQQKGEAMTEVETSDGRVSELEQKLQAENQQKLEALEKVEMLEVRVADLEEQSHTSSDSDDQMRREFAETVQLCEHLATEKDVMATELDYLKQELGMFIEQTESLETEKAAMWKELEERRETDEFKSLEEEFRKEQENELQNEISSLKEAVQASEVQSQELQNKLDVLSEELKKKSDFVEELQSMSGKDLVQEVAKLRRSLDDAEGLSRDTKKEWAHLRSENIALEESNVTLTTNHENMEAEVNSLRFQLEKEKSRYRQMQSDLQKELNVVFDENTKLTTLLDGKVPKNLIDSVELERTVAGLNKELAASHEAEEALRAQLDELASIQTLQDQVDNLMQQVCELTEELCAAQTHRDSLISAQAQSQEEALQLRDALQMSQEEILTVRAELSDAALREEQVESLRQTLENSEAEKSQLNSAVQEELSKLTESEELRESLTEKLNDMQQLVKDLEEKLADSEVSKTTEEEISKELQEQLNQLTEELRVVRAETDTSVCAGAQPSAETENKLFTVAAERDQLKADLQKHVDMAAETQLLLQSLQNELQEQRSDLEKLYEQKESDLREQMQSLSEELERMRAEKETLPSAAQMSSEETEKLLSAVSTLTAERDQLRMDLQENVELMIENQDELRTALERNNEQKEMIKQLQSARTSKQDGPDPSDTSAQLEELQTRMMTLSEQLQSVESERDALLCERTADSQTEEMEKLQHRVTSLSEDRDQLQDTLDTLRQEKQQLREESEGRMETLQEEMKTLTEQLQSVVSERDALLCERTADSQTEEMEKLQHRVTSLSEDRDQLQDTLDTLRQEKQQLREESEGRMETLQEEMKTLTEQLQSVVSERETLLSEKETSCQSSSEEMEKQQLREEMEKLQHRVTSLSEDRDQLQETLEAVRQEKKQLREEMEERMEMLQSELQQQQLNSEPRSLREEQEAQQLLQIQQLEEHLSRAKQEVSQLKSDLQENVELMIENQEELRVSQEKIRVLQEEINVMRKEKTELESKQSERNDGEATLQIQQLQNKVQSVTEQLQSVESERDALLRERTADSQPHSEEMEKLQHRVTSLSEDRYQLQETLEAVRQEKQQLREEMETLQEEVAQLNMTLQTLMEQKKQLEDDLQQNINTASTSQELLESVQEKLQEQKRVNGNLEREIQEKDDALDQQVRTLTEELQSVSAERDKQVKTLSEKLTVAHSERDAVMTELETSCLSSSEDMEKLQHRVTSLSEDRDQLQVTLEAVRQEKQQLAQTMEDKMETLQEEIKTVSEQLQSVVSERDALLCKRTADSQTHSEEMEKLQHRVTSLSEDRDQLQETLEAVRQEKQQLTQTMEDRMEMISSLQEQLSRQEAEREEREAELQQKLLTEANETISALKGQLSCLDQSSRGVKESAESQLQDSADQLQEAFRKLQNFIEACSKFNSTALGLAPTVQESLTPLPKPANEAFCQVELQAAQTLGEIIDHVQGSAQGYRTLFEELVRKDLDVYEERRLQDVLLCRAQAPSFSVKDEDFNSMWEQRLSDLLDKRNLYLKKMECVSEKLLENIKMYSSEVSTEKRERARFKEQLKLTSTRELDSFLSRELDTRSALSRSRKTTLKGIIDEHNSLFGEMKLLQTQTDTRLQEERSRRLTLLQPLEGAPLKTELSLMKDNKQLCLQLQETEERIKALCAHKQQLEEAQIKANNRVSNHKEATQLLQTELQDSRAQVEEKENMIQTLRSKLRESERNANPSAAELEKLQTKLFKMEVELSSASDKHQQEIQRMTTLLKEKEESLRKLKETLRKSQQQGEESFLQGEDLHARLTNPRGVVIKTSILQEKTKLEEEVKQLQMKITELESLVSAQQAEIGKWKSRAIKLKAKNRTDADKPSPPCTPTKRGLPVTADSSTFYSSPKKFLITPRKPLESPMKQLDSPNVPLLDSPKSRFFDVGGGTELLSRTCPKQFFDNSSLGTVPEVSDVPDSPAEEKGAGASADRKDEWWPQSPKQEDMCKTQ